MRLSLLSTLCTLALAARVALPAPEPSTRTGQINVPGVTGAVMLRGDRLLLVSGARNGVYVLPTASERLLGGRATPEPLALAGKVELEDLADATWDSSGDAFVLTSHGRTTFGDAPDARYRLARLHFDATGALLEARVSGALLQAVVNDVPFLADSIRRTPARAGLNAGGLAWDPQGMLVIGLRSPTVTESRPRATEGQEDAVVLRVKNPDALFQEPPQPAQLADVVKLDLRGQGIHGLAYDPERKAYWLLSGLSVAPNHAVKSPWGLWLWDGTGAPRRVAVPGVDLEAPGAVCRVEIDHTPYLLLIDPGKTTSRYALIPALGLREEAGAP
jgi:hypothetical protein